MDSKIPSETESKYISGEEEIIEEFKEQFQIIKSKGFIKPRGTQNSGIGKTFEDRMKIKGKNRRKADYKNHIEIKSKCNQSGSKITLFTKSPDYPPGSNTYLKDTYGLPDDTYNNMKHLRTTVSAVKFSTFRDDIGFKLECSDEEEKLYIVICDLITGKIIERSIYYRYETLEKILSEKCTNIAYVNAETKIAKSGTIKYRFTSAKLLTGCTFEKFIKAVKDGIITYDIKIGFYKSGKLVGKTHDHGSGFRIKKGDISQIFTVTDL